MNSDFEKIERAAFDGYRDGAEGRARRTSFASPHERMTYDASLASGADKPSWSLIGFSAHKWRTGRTWHDRHGGNLLSVHHGFYSLEWARGESIEIYRSMHRSR